MNYASLLQYTDSLLTALAEFLQTARTENERKRERGGALIRYLLTNVITDFAGEREWWREKGGFRVPTSTRSFWSFIQQSARLLAK